MPKRTGANSCFHMDSVAGSETKGGNLFYFFVLLVNVLVCTTAMKGKMPSLGAHGRNITAAISLGSAVVRSLNGQP